MTLESQNGGSDEGSNQDTPQKNVFRQWLEHRPDSSTISAKNMGVAEESAWKEVLLRIHPTWDEEDKRADIILFLQTIITQSIEGIQVFPYGSVPLKTYLGDGDIDLTVICNPDVKDSLANDIYSLLKNEEVNIYAEYTVKETNMIGAEVKLVRCKVENISIDISFNQLGGLSTLCFLEYVDRLVNKNHLFKQSVLLIKAWCHYESHILGAYHGLLATYALESLILFIFQMFSSSLNGPLAVLFQFLDYYGKFDWNNYSISLDGPVRTSSLPDLVCKHYVPMSLSLLIVLSNNAWVVPIEFFGQCCFCYAVTDRGNDGAEFLLSGEDLKLYTDLFAASTYSVEQDMRIFVAMYLNIIDPLKRNNNLGRSVNKGNSTRIRAAFKYGARNLGRILLLPSESIPGEIKKFFECTLMKFKSNDAKLENLSPLSLSEEDVNMKSVEDDIDDVMLNLEGARLARDESDPVTARSLSEYLDMEIVENSNLLDLTSDYTSLVRNFMHGRYTLGYCATIPEISISPPTINAQCKQVLWNSMQWNLKENAAVAGQLIYAENSFVRGTGTFIPNMDSTSFRERSSHRRSVNLMQESCKQSQRNIDNLIQTSDEFIPEPSQKDNTKEKEKTVVEERIPAVKSINLNNESEFPPLN